jgi:hypothetical protein
MKWVRHGGPERRTHGVRQTGVGVGDHQSGARQSPGHQAPQEGQPARSVLGGDDVEAEDLAVSIVVHPGGDHHGHVLDAPRLAHLLDHGVEPHVGVGPGVEGPVPDGGYLGI